MQDTSRDSLLETLIKIAEMPSPADAPEIFHVTLTVGGMLVTGRIISHDEFMRHHPLIEKLWDRYPRPISEIPPQKRVTGVEERWCIHLADARFLAPGQATSPATGSGVFWRGRLSEVSGLSFVQAVDSSR